MENRLLNPESMNEYSMDRRLGDFLKELGLTEGRATGIPTIQKHLRLNGNAPATIETDDDRTYFLMTIPCREDMFGQNDIDPANQVEDFQQNDARLEQILGQSFVKVQNIVYQSSIIDKRQLLQILEQLSVKVWDKSKKPIDKEVLSRLTIEMIEFLRINPSTVKQLLEFLNYSNSPEFRRKILNPMIELGFIVMKNPDKPTSSKQQYLLTDKALELF